MLATLSRDIPDGDGWSYEPKWDGFRCIVFRDGDEVMLTSRNERPFNRYFPELLPALAAALPALCVVDGEIVVPAGEDGAAGLDFDALQTRIHPAASRVAMLADATPASFVAFDLLALDQRDLQHEPFAERRLLLERSLVEHEAVHLTPLTTDHAVATDWFHRFEGAGLDGVVAKQHSSTYQPGKRGWVKVKHERTGCAIVVGHRLHKDSQGVGSLVLGLSDASGQLHHVGVASGFTAKRRAELLVELTPLSETTAHEAPPGATSRWNAGRDLSFTALRTPRVAEVTFGQLQGGRFRHGVRFLRWRDDLSPQQCRIDQLDVASPVPFHELVGQRPQR